MSTEGLQFSALSGFRLADFDTSCSIDSTRQCAAKQFLVSIYVGNAGQEGVPLDISLSDKIVLEGKLAEYSLWSPSADYSPDNTAECPTRLVIDNSRTRQMAVRGIRKLIHRDK